MAFLPSFRAAVSPCVRRTAAATNLNAGRRAARMTFPRACGFASSTRRQATPTDSVDDPAAAQAIASYNSALEALQAGDFEKASQECEKAIATHGPANASPDLLFALGVIQQQGGRIPEAIMTWERVLELQERADVHTNLAASYMVHPTGQDPQKAKYHILKAQALEPLDKEITFNAAVIHEVCQDYEAADLEYRKAKDLGVPQADAHIRNVGLCRGIISSNRRLTQLASPDWRQAPSSKA